MTTAARPTFDPARGGSGRGEKDLSALSKQYSSRDLPGQTSLKYRFVLLNVFYKIIYLIKFFNHAENRDKELQKKLEDVTSEQF